MKQIFLLTLLVFIIPKTKAQDSILTLTLKEVITLAQSDAPDVLLAETRLSNNYWRYQSFLADYRPQIDLSLNSDLNRSVDDITQPNGSVVFAAQSFMSNFGGISLRQDIATTGGTIFANTGLQRLDQFESDLFDPFTAYLFSPVSIEIEQPLFTFNFLKWAKKVEPLRYEESKLQYTEEMEQIAYEAASRFFDLYNDQLNVEAARIEKKNADTLLERSKGRFSVGRIAETELLQIELSAMRADAKLAQAILDLQTANEALRNFMGITRKVEFRLKPPTTLPEFNIDANKALAFARKNRSKALEFRRKLMEADRDVAMAKGEVGPTFNLTGRFGLQRSTEKLDDVFMDLLDEERVAVGVQIPIADWGKAKARLQIAESNRDLEQMNVEQEQVNFEREILLKVQQFDLVRNQVALALRAYEVSQKRNEITRKRYLIGKIGITDLNIAIREEDDARRAYMSALRAFWLAYYELRNLTLYDFEKDEPLIWK